MIIEIKDDGNGAWNLVAKAGQDDWPPLYIAYGRSPWAVKALVGGILSDFDALAETRSPEAKSAALRTAARPSPHDYLSTACLHEAEALAVGDARRAEELHAYCAGDTGTVGAKKPAVCKFCDAACFCNGHQRPASRGAS